MTWASNESGDEQPFIPLPDCGQRVSVESRRHEEKLWTHMIGFKPGAYVVLEKPPGTDAIDGKRALKDGDSLVVRFLKDGTIYGFRTPVLATAIAPYRLLFVGFPVEIAEHSLRSSPRLECYLPCEGQVGGRAFTRAFIRDFSATGCQLRIPLDALEPPSDTADGDGGSSNGGPQGTGGDRAAGGAGDDRAAAAHDGADAAETGHAASRPGGERPADGDDGDAASGTGGAASPDGEHAGADPDGDVDGDALDDENRLTLELQLPGDDEIRIAHGDVLEWQTFQRFHQVRVKFDEPQEEIFEQLSLYTTRLG